MAFQSSQCWYKIIDDKFKIDDDEIKKHGIYIDKCVECKFPIISSSFQQAGCGSRYCNDCFNKMKPKYYCQICKDEDPNNFIHKKDDIFEDKAFRNDLAKMTMQCPDCPSEICIVDLEDHARFVCKQGWEMCHKCESLFKKMFAHDCLDKGDIFVDAMSPFKICEKCFKECSDNEKHVCKMSWEDSCPHDCQLEVYDEEHRNEAALSHLDKLWAMCKEMKMTDCKKADDSTEFQAWYDSSIESIKAGLNFDSKNIKKLRNEVDILNKQLVEEKKIHDDIIKHMLSHASEFLNTSFDGTIMWRLDNFSKLKEDANNSTQVRVFSQPFYTSRFGYKMCLLLYPNGDSNARGKAISLFLVIMKGNFDAMLRWPFQQKITFSLIDQQLQTNISQSFSPATNMSSFSMPRTDMNTPAGISSFVNFEEMNSMKFKYVKDNTVFIHCTVDCSDLHE